MEMDLTSSLAPAVALTIQTINTNTTTFGAIIDSLGFEALDFNILTGTVTDGTYVITMQDGDDSGLSDAAAVAADFIIGLMPPIVAADDNVARHFGYVGKKRYVRLQIVSTGTTTGAVIGAVAVKGHAKSAPTFAFTA